MDEQNKKPDCKPGKFYKLKWLLNSLDLSDYFLIVSTSIVCLCSLYLLF